MLVVIPLFGAGQDLVDRWIHVVTWKLYDVFGLALGPGNFIDLDSSSEVKFSRHLVVIIAEDGGAAPMDQAAPNTTQRSRHTTSPADVLLPVDGHELLFRNNIEVGRLVDIIVSDVLLESEDAGCPDAIVSGVFIYLLCVVHE